MKHVVFAIGSLHGGGAERVVSVWASGLVEKGYCVSIIVYARLENEYSIDPRVAVYPIAPSVHDCEEMSIIQRLMCFRATLRKLKPSVVISFLPEIQVYVALATIGLRIPRVETIRVNPWKANILHTKFAQLWHWCFRSCHALIVQSEDQLPFFSHSVQKKAVIIPNPINLLYINHQKLNYCPSSHKIVAAGRLTEQKNYKMMIDAVKQVTKEYEDVVLQIYGDGEQETQLASYIQEQDLVGNVSLMGRSNALYRIYQDADLYIMSSNYEGMPNALAEAMAVGLPCISTDCKTGPRHLIDDGETGYLVPCGDTEAMSKRICHIFSMTSEEQRAIGQKAREKVVDFCSEENSLKRLITLIECF